MDSTVVSSAPDLPSSVGSPCAPMLDVLPVVPTDVVPADVVPPTDLSSTQPKETVPPPEKAPPTVPAEKLVSAVILYGDNYWLFELNNPSAFDETEAKDARGRWLYPLTEEQAKLVPGGPYDGTLFRRDSTKDRVFRQAILSTTVKVISVPDNYLLLLKEEKAHVDELYQSFLKSEEEEMCHAEEEEKARHAQEEEEARQRAAAAAPEHSKPKHGDEEQPIQSSAPVPVQPKVPKPKNKIRVNSFVAMRVENNGNEGPQFQLAHVQSEHKWVLYDRIMVVKGEPWYSATTATVTPNLPSVITTVKVVNGTLSFDETEGAQHEIVKLKAAALEKIAKSMHTVSDGEYENIKNEEEEVDVGASCGTCQVDDAVVTPRFDRPVLTTAGYRLFTTSTFSQSEQDSIQKGIALAASGEGITGPFHTVQLGTAEFGTLTTKAYRALCKKRQSNLVEKEAAANNDATAEDRPAKKKRRVENEVAVVAETTNSLQQLLSQIARAKELQKRDATTDSDHTPQGDPLA